MCHTYGNANRDVRHIILSLSDMKLMPRPLDAFVCCLFHNSVTSCITASNYMMTGERWIGRDLEGSCYNVIDVLS
jgi:hypothetical protein